MKAMYIISFLILFTCGCMGPSILSSRSRIEFYHVTTEGKVDKRTDASPTTISAEKQYDANASVSTGGSTANALTEKQKKAMEEEAKAWREQQAQEEVK